MAGNVIVGMGENGLPAERFHIKGIHVCNYSPFRHQAASLGRNASGRSIESWRWVLTKRYIFLPTTVVEAPTSFGGTSPEVFLQKVVRS